MVKILAIDDNNDNLITLKAIMKDAFSDSVLDTALSGIRGIEIAMEKDPDVILLDVLMPGMDGYQVCSKLKEDKRLSDIPVVFLTAIRDNKDSRIKALEVGAEAFLSKPIDITELTAQIRAMVKIKAANRQKYHEKERLALLVDERTRELERSQEKILNLLEDLKVENETRRKTEKYFRTLIEKAPDGVVLLGKDGQLNYASPAAKKIFGYPESYTDLPDPNASTHPEDLAKVLAILESICQNPTLVSTLEYRFQKKDGTWIWIESTFSNQFSEPAIEAIVINFREITERKLAEDQIRTLGKAIEQGPSSIVITNEKGDIEFVNNQFTSFTQYTLEDVKGRKPRIFNPGHLSEMDYTNLWETFQKGNTWKGEVDNRKKDKSTYLEELTISALKKIDGSVCNYIIISNDITEKKQMLNELVSAKEKAEESDRLKSAFLANMSHEIRTPLNSIIGFSELMLEPDFETKQQVEFAQMINTSGYNMLSIINDLMDISKIEAGQVRIVRKTMSVNRLIQDVQKEYSFKAREKGLELRLDPSNAPYEIFIESDENRLKQILVNFVSNALKFTKEGFIEIGFSRKDAFVLFHVKDTGIGIPPAFHHKIFERFRQVESDYTREYGGNGLGLAISKSLTELLGGKIGLESEIGQGSTFFIEIPLR